MFMLSGAGRGRALSGLLSEELPSITKYRSPYLRRKTDYEVNYMSLCLNTHSEEYSRDSSSLILTFTYTLLLLFLAVIIHNYL